MSFTVSSLTEYVNQESTNLIHRLYFEGTTQQYVSFQPGVKHKEALQLFDVTAYPQDDSCTNTASGSTTFTQAEIAVVGIKYFDALCPVDLESKWTQKLLRAGAQGQMESLTFEEDVAMAVLSLIQENNETLIWQGDDAGSNTDPITNKFDGYTTLIDAAGTATAGNTGGVSAISATATDATNAVTVVNAMIDARPAKLRRKPNQVLFCGTDVFDKWVTAQIVANNFHIDRTDQEGYSTKIPGKNVTLVGVHGLDGTNRMFLGQTSNFYIGVDGMNDNEQFEMWYSKDDDKIYYRVRYKLGVQIARIADIVQFTLA